MNFFKSKAGSLLIVIHLFLIFSCGTIKPEKPIEQVIENPPVLAPITTEIVVPIEMSLTSYLTQANAKIPKFTRGSDKPCSGIRYDYEFQKDSFNIRTSNNKLLSELHGSYWIKMEYCASCTDLLSSKPICISPIIPFSCGIKEDKPQIRIRLSTELGISENYSLQTKTSIDELKSLNPCEVTLFRFDATEEVIKEVRKTLKKQCEETDKQLETISFQKDAKDLWKNMNQTIQIPYLGFIHFEPLSLALVKPRLENNKLYTTLVLNSRTYLNQNSTKPVSTELPPLKILAKAPKDTFELFTDFELNYDSLSTLFSEQITGKKLDFKKNHIEFNSARISGLDQNKILLTIQFSGTKNGILYLQGTPTFNNESKILELSNLTYDLKTKSVLLKSASWLFSDRIYTELEKATKLDLTSQFNDLKKGIDKNLQRKSGDFSLLGKTHDIRVIAIFPTINFLYLRTCLKAQLTVKQ
ncbi:DUF4403 family protein [Fluviicola taffensis]|uniref:DUF4403 family protein n=1 Tax=Fluviicola taffensis (strain DSM 16823 / NCIMB 13979 / RW262) TaxID=755732 RepID=F2II49_FLUTR|nr:DUF4403 family protein [Fluviicola taffensis]AEA42749.1 hypothetical protein Fluta_0745 [Fluviicola taffensis DSM 16823]